MQHTISELEYELADFNDYSSSALLLATLQWANQQGFWQPFSRLLAIDMKTVVYSPLHKLQTLIASILVGCHYNKDVNARLVPDRPAAALLGLERFPDQSQLNILLRRLDQSNILQLQAVHAEQLRTYEQFTPLPHWHDYLFVDIDQCGLSVNGKKYELAQKGFFSRKRGAIGYQLGAAWLGSSQVTLAMHFDPGSYHCTWRLADLVAESEARCAAAKVAQQVVFRLDAGYGGTPQVSALLAGKKKFLLRSAVKRADKWAGRVAADAWQIVPGANGVRVAEVAAGPQLRGIVCEILAPADKLEYSLLLTNLPAEFDAVALWQLYSERQTIEAFFKTGQHVYGMDNLRSREYMAIYGFMWLVFIGHNLLQWAKASLFAGSALARVGTRELVEKLGRVPARRERTERGWRLLLPSQDALARRLVAALCPQWVQLPLRL